ncbi:MAG: hypothetical protein ACI4P8_04170 [Akkermansia sp.]
MPILPLNPWLRRLEGSGLDVPLTALCWGCASARLMEIPMLTNAPLTVTVTSLWGLTLGRRLWCALRLPKAPNAAFYRGHLAPLLFLLGGLVAATLWMLTFYVGQRFWGYLLTPVWLSMVGLLLPGKRLRRVGELLCCCALAQLIVAPAFYDGFMTTPLHALFCAPVWYLGVLLFLFGEEQRSDGESPLVPKLSLCLLLGACLLSLKTAPPFEYRLCLAVAVGAGCLHGLGRLRRRGAPCSLLGELRWAAALLPALLSILL